MIRKTLRQVAVGRHVDHFRQGLRDLVLGVVDVADVGGDRETGRHRQAGIRHLGEAGALASERVLHRAVAVGLAVAEEVHVLRAAAGGLLPLHPAEGCGCHRR